MAARRAQDAAVLVANAGLRARLGGVEEAAAVLAVEAARWDKPARLAAAGGSADRGLALALGGAQSTAWAWADTSVTRGSCSSCTAAREFARKTCTHASTRCPLGRALHRVH